MEGGLWPGFHCGTDAYGMTFEWESSHRYVAGYFILMHGPYGFSYLSGCRWSRVKKSGGGNHVTVSRETLTETTGLY